MVQPEDDVPVVAVILEVWPRDGDWLVGVVGEDGKRARSIETDAANRSRVYLGVRHHLLHADADGVPDIGSGLFLGIGVSKFVSPSLSFP